MTLRYELMPGWPTLAWEAQCDRATRIVHVRHGPGVETHDEWFCEAAWDAPFADGNFDETDIVVGSGGRLRGSELVFVSAGNTVDRLQSVKTPGGAIISNSLSCLLASGLVTFDPAYNLYYDDFRTIVGGLRCYRRDVHALAGEVRLHYFDNIVWTGEELQPRAKPWPPRRFRTFQDYESFLLQTMSRLSANARDHSRKLRFEGLGTVSTGYDSPTVGVIGKQVGAFEEVLTFTTARGGSSDDGTPIADAIGLRTRQVEREAYRSLHDPEVPFIAANAYGEESHYAGAEDILAGRVLYTGFHGDKAWAKDTPNLSPDLVRGDPTGLALTDYRLRAGFLHCPVPFWGVRQIRDIVKISNSPELRGWDVPGDYSRPICRRIVESAGVDRRLFGQAKNAASVTMFNPREKFLSASSLSSYRDWLARTPGTPAAEAGPRVRAFRALYALLSRAPERIVPESQRSWLQRRSVPLFYHLFPWAAERAAYAFKGDRSEEEARGVVPLGGERG